MISYLLLDVRSRKDFCEKNIPGSINIPHNEIMNNLATIPKSSTVIVYADGGQKSGIISAVLKRLDFTIIDAKTIAAANNILTNINRA